MRIQPRFGRPEAPPKVTFADLMYNEEWGDEVRDHDPALLSLNVTTIDGTDWASWSFNSARVVEKAEALFNNPEHFTIITDGERDVHAMLPVTEVAKLVFGDIGGAHEAAVAKTEELFRGDGLVDRNLSDGLMCDVTDDGYVFASTSPEDVRARVITSTDAFVTGTETKVQRARNSQLAKINRAKRKHPALIDEIDQRLAAADASTANLPIHARLLPALERGNDGRGRRT